MLRTELEKYYGAMSKTPEDRQFFYEWAGRYQLLTTVTNYVKLRHRGGRNPEFEKLLRALVPQTVWNMVENSYAGSQPVSSPVVEQANGQ